MQLPTNIIVAGLFFIAALGLFTLIFSHKHEPAAQEEPDTQATDRLNNYIEEIEKQNDQERDQREEADKLAKQIKAKKESVECQFWTKQQATQASKRNAEKVTQFCEL
jgi:septal ring factor EnvC (AmiA/AmiB activator)